MNPPRNCYECERPIRWGSRNDDGKPLAREDREMLRCWDCEADRRARRRRKQQEKRDDT